MTWPGMEKGSVSSEARSFMSLEPGWALRIQQGMERLVSASTALDSSGEQSRKCRLVPWV